MPKLIQILTEPNEDSSVHLYGLADDGSVWCMRYDKTFKGFSWTLMTKTLEAIAPPK